VRAAGFTLIEVLVAVAIFALIGIVSAGLLSRTLEAREIAFARADRLEAVQRAVLRLERDLLQIVDRSVRDGFGDVQPALRLDEDGFTFTRLGWRNPLEAPRSDAQRVRWSVDGEGRLQRHFFSVLDRAQDSEARTQTVLADVTVVDWRIVDADGGRWQRWPPEAGETPEALLPGASSTGEAVPVAVRVTLELTPFGRIERLVPLPVPVDPDPESVEAPVDEASAEGAAAEGPGDA
jgi:general secretion pathway protein J